MPVTSESLLNQIQQRFLTIAHINTQSQYAQPLLDLFASLYQSQKNGNGILTISEVEASINIELLTLRQEYPALLGTTEDTAPITVFESFIAFRSIYLQLVTIKQTLSQRNKFLPPSDLALTRISWELNSGALLNDEQKLAAYTTACYSFSIITGGAGTGKTTTLIKALELILLDHPESDILLAAPTGKAAQRLESSLKYQLTSVDHSVRNTLNQLNVQTLHRLLAVSERDGHAFKNENNPLACQVLAIDEASMIGSDLLMQVFSALPPKAKLILLGDPNQLPPINAVAFFNDISLMKSHYSTEFIQTIQNDLALTLPNEYLHDDTILSNQICLLKKPNRFKEQSIIEQAAEAILNNESNKLISVLGDYLYPIKQTNILYQQLADSYPASKVELLTTLPSRMILCANRRGELGSQAINSFLDKCFRKCIAGNTKEEWYEGRQILIEKNYPDLQLSNGDIGQCVWYKNHWAINFGYEKPLAALSLPSDYSLAFAITIHKSQGSEYCHIDIVLDCWNKETANLLINRPLIYTAITRAKQSLSVYSDEELLKQAINKSSDGNNPSPLSKLLQTQHK